MGTEAIRVPTIGIEAAALVRRAGHGVPRFCSASERAGPPNFVRQYAEVGRIATEAISAFADDVRAGRFPSDAESYHGSAELGDALS